MKKSNSSILFLIAMLFSAFILVSCATIMGKGSAETLSLRSTPDRATIVIMDESGTKVFEGQTPTSLPLEKKKGYFSGKKYTVTISSVGYTDKSITVDTRVNGWYIAGNIIFGGLIGWIVVDPLTGAMWTLDTNELNVTMEAKKTSSDIPNVPGIILLGQVPSSLRSRMVRVQ